MQRSLAAVIGIALPVQFACGHLNAADTRVATPNPIPAPILESGLVVELVDIALAPTSGPKNQPALLNFLFHAGDGSGRLFVADSRGKILIVSEGRILARPYLDLVEARGESFVVDNRQQGLRSFAFHPDFARDGSPGFGKFYTAHTESALSALANPKTPRFASPIGKVDHDDVISEWTVDRRRPDRIDPGSRREIMRVAQPLEDHNVGLIAFNPNAKPGGADYGMLYVAVGNGGSTFWNGPVAQYGQAQDTTTVLGSILRIDPLERDGRPYTVPDDNPFVGDAHARPEIWAYGLRNPQRFAWDPAGDGKMLIADIGGANVEEVNIGAAGANYGWAEREGTFVVERDDQEVLYSLPDDDARRGYTYPVLQYDHDEGNAIVGGFVYRGRAVSALDGKYVFGDIVNGRLFVADVDGLEPGRQATIQELAVYHRGRATTLRSVTGGDNRVDLRFGLDEDGEIYVLTKTDGMIRALRARPSMASPASEVDPARVERKSRSGGNEPELRLERFDLRDLIDTGRDAFGPT